jgi:type I restriction enzyme M protein
VLDYHADKQMDFVMANPPVQHQGLEPHREGPALALRRAARRQRELRVDPAHPVQAHRRRPGRRRHGQRVDVEQQSGGEGEIRARIVEADLVSCMVALPTQLFRSTGIPVCLWFFAKDKSAGKQGSVDRTGQVLFIDARELGFMVDRAERSLAAEDIARIAETYHAWRGSQFRCGKQGSRMPTCRVSAPASAWRTSRRPSTP